MSCKSCIYCKNYICNCALSDEYMDCVSPYHHCSCEVDRNEVERRRKRDTRRSSRDLLNYEEE